MKLSDLTLNKSCKKSFDRVFGRNFCFWYRSDFICFFCYWIFVKSEKYRTFLFSAILEDLRKSISAFHFSYQNIRRSFQLAPGGNKKIILNCSVKKNPIALYHWTLLILKLTFLSLHTSLIWDILIIYFDFRRELFFSWV